MVDRAPSLSQRQPKPFSAMPPVIAGIGFQFSDNFSLSSPPPHTVPSGEHGAPTALSSLEPSRQRRTPVLGLLQDAASSEHSPLANNGTEQRVPDSFHHTSQSAAAATATATATATASSSAHYDGHAEPDVDFLAPPGNVNAQVPEKRFPAPQSMAQGREASGSGTPAERPLPQPGAPHASSLPSTPSGDAAREKQIDYKQQIVLAVAWKNGYIGASYFETDTLQLHLLTDIRDNSDLDVFEAVLIQASPDIIVLSSKLDDAVLDRMGRLKESGVIPASTQIEHLPASDFAFETCKRRLLSTKVAMIPLDFSDAEKEMFWNSLAPWESVQMIRSAGALVKFLDKKRIGMQLESPSEKVALTTVHLFSLKNAMLLDENAFSSLQIFPKRGDTDKDGLSLFGIVNHTRTSVGYKMLKLWFLRPLADAQAITERHRTVEFLALQENTDALKAISDCLRHIKNVNRIVGSMQRSRASASDWSSLSISLYYMVRLQEVCQPIQNMSAVFKEVATAFGSEIRDLFALVNRIVDFDESADQNRFVVKSGVDESLDEMKRMYHGLPDIMTQVAIEEMNDNPYIDECNVVYFPQIGYLIAIPRAPDDQPTGVALPENIDIPNLAFQFSTQRAAHYKSARTREMDETLGDIHGDIIDRETEIMHALQERIVRQSSLVAKIMDLIASLDCYISFAAVARERNYRRPTMVNNNATEIIGGRHPLQELCVDTFISNDTHISAAQGRMQLITGPNASGKSIYLKQIALIQFMAQIGCFVPAERAVLGCCDRIFTRIQTRETVSISQSTFMIDLSQVSVALRHSTRQSLIVIDEFGKGTLSGDGMALLAAVMNELLDRGRECPRTLVSTHFHEIRAPGVISQSAVDTGLLRLLTMECLEASKSLSEGDEGDESGQMRSIISSPKRWKGGAEAEAGAPAGDELVFLYKVVPGFAKSSLGCRIAALAGLPVSLVARGAQVSDLYEKGAPIPKLGDLVADGAKRKKMDEMVSAFLAFDFEHGDLETLLEMVRASGM